MKKAFLIIAVLLAAATVAFATGACSQGGDTSAPISDVSDTVSDAEPVSRESDASEQSVEESRPDAESSVSEQSEDDESKPGSEEEDSGIRVLYCSYSEKPYFALVGTCDEGAVVTAEASGETVTSQSWHGWFSVRLKCESSSVEVSLTQSVNGTQVGGTKKHTARPVTPGAEMWPVVTGKDFQFFFQKMLPDFYCTNLPSEYQLNQLTARVRNRINSLKNTSPYTEIIYMIVPSAMTVYPELVPSQYSPGFGDTRLDKVNAALEAGGATVIDLKEEFALHKNDEKPLYYKLDSHWTDYGAYVAYNALFEHISQKIPQAAPRAESEFVWNEGFYNSGDMTYYLAMAQNVVKEYAYYRTLGFDAPQSITSVPRYRSGKDLVYNDRMTYANTIYTNRPELPSCMVLRDSYSTQIYDILAERMNTTDYKGMWDYSWYTSEINSSKPDYIIYIVAEWNIDSILAA